MKRLLRAWTAARTPALDLAAYCKGLFDRSSSAAYARQAGLFPGYIRQGEASAFCLEHAKQYCSGRGLDIGAGAWPFPGARVVEDGEQENAYRLGEPDGSIDFVFSSHCLEHLDRWREALAEWTRVLRPGGILYLYLPHPAAGLWRPEVLSYHAWSPTPQLVSEALEANGVEILDRSFMPDGYLSFFVVGRRRPGAS